MPLLTRLRGIVMTAAIWGAAWALASVLYLLGTWLIVQKSSLAVLFPDYFLIGALAWGIWGVLTGAGFAIVLALAERRNTLEALSLSRVAMWGALGAAAMPLATYFASLFWVGVSLGGITVSFSGGIGLLGSLLLSAALGAGAAAGHLSLARRSPEAQRSPQLRSGAAT